MKRFLRSLLCLGAALFFAGKVSAGTVVPYPLPSCYTVTSQATMTADGINIPIITHVASALYNYAEFSHSGTTTITITASATITSYTISPLAYNIQGTVSGKTLTFTVTGSQYVIVSINSLKKIVIAADALETDVPASSGAGIYNIAAAPYNADATGATLTTTNVQKAIDDATAAGGGIVYVPAGVFTCGNLILKSNVSLYLAGGSVLRGTTDTSKYSFFYDKTSLNRNGTYFVYTEQGSSNIKVYGRGTIDANGDYLRNSKNYLAAVLVPLETTNFTVDGVILRDGSFWSFTPSRSNHVTATNTKHFNENNNDFEDDAIDVQESQHVTLNHVLAISEDDSYSTKTWDVTKTGIAAKWIGAPQLLDDVSFLNCIGWSPTATFKIGNGMFESQSNITVKNFISYSSSRAIAFNPAYGTGTTTNLLIDTVDIEGYNPRFGNPNQWLDINILGNTPMINSIVRNVNIRNLGTTASNMYGYNATGVLNGLILENIHVPGRTAPASTLAQMNVTKVNGYIQNIQILPLVPSNNLALHKHTSVSSLFSAGNIASSATDGITATRWESAYADPQWLSVDLGKTYNINKVIITWESALGKDFKIQTSNDSVTWTTIRTVTGNTVKADTISGLSGSGRYIRMYGTARATGFGYSIYEFEVYGSGPVPVIGALSPASGSVGTAVTISGSNFNTTAANNIVFFGATQATVTAATATQLTVTVPIGASYQPVSVLNTDYYLTGYSPSPFNTTFAGIPNGTTPKVDYASGLNPAAVATADLNGDGKIDMVVANAGANTISVYENTATVNSISGSSFANKADITTGTAPASIAIGDLNGDGRPDIAVANYNGGSVSVFMNTSVGTSISFSAKTDYKTGSNPASVAIGDVDMDGKPDLAVANAGSNTVVCLLNTSGLPGAISFGAAQTLITAGNPSSVILKDVNADGKPDIIFTSYANGQVSVISNSSTPGTISGSALMTLAAGANPQTVVAGDIDGDGKIDLLTVNKGSNTISIFRNTTQGPLSFAAKADVATGLAPQAITLGDLDRDNKPEIIVANSGSGSFTVYHNGTTAGSINTGDFIYLQAATGTTPTSADIADIDGDGVPDILVGNFGSNTVSIFRNSTSAAASASFSNTATSIATAATAPVVHTALSPNGDGVNDVLTVDNIERYPDNKLTIMNANGTKVYEVSGFNNHTKTFDGHSNITGAMQNAGTYYYQLQYRYNGIMQNKTGYIVIKY